METSVSRSGKVTDKRAVRMTNCPGQQVSRWGVNNQCPGKSAI